MLREYVYMYFNRTSRPGRLCSRSQTPPYMHSGSNVSEGEILAAFVRVVRGGPIPPSHLTLAMGPAAIIEPNNLFSTPIDSIIVALLNSYCIGIIIRVITVTVLVLLSSPSRYTAERHINCNLCGSYRAEPAKPSSKNVPQRYGRSFTSHRFRA